MSDQTIRRLYTIIAALAVVYGLLLFWQYRQTLPETPVLVSTAGLSRTADRLIITSGGQNATLDRRKGKWFIGRKAVGSIKIGTFLSAMDNFAIARVVSSKSAGNKDYGLDGNANSLKVYQNKKLVRALYFGAMATANTYFVKTDSGPTIYEAQGDLIFEVGQPVSGWARPERPLK